MFLQKWLGPCLYGTPPEKLSRIQCEPEMERGICFSNCYSKSQSLLRSGLQTYLLTISRSNGFSKELRRDKVVVGEERNKTLKHQGKIWRGGDNGRRFRG